MVYRFPCRIGMCKTPIEVALSHLIASEVFPDVAVKAFLYPGAIAKAIISNTAIPSYDDLLNFLKFSYMEAASAATDLKNLEVCSMRIISLSHVMFDSFCILIGSNKKRMRKWFSFLTLVDLLIEFQWLWGVSKCTKFINLN